MRPQATEAEFVLRSAEAVYTYRQHHTKNPATRRGFSLFVSLFLLSLLPFFGGFFRFLFLEERFFGEEGFLHHGRRRGRGFRRGGHGELALQLGGGLLEVQDLLDARVHVADEGSAVQDLLLA